MQALPGLKEFRFSGSCDSLTCEIPTVYFGGSIEFPAEMAKPTILSFQAVTLMMQEACT